MQRIASNTKPILNKLSCLLYNKAEVLSICFMNIPNNCRLMFFWGVFIVCIFCGSKGTILLLKMDGILARRALGILAGELGLRLHTTETKMRWKGEQPKGGVAETIKFNSLKR
jgi:hypothetical protein